MWYGPPRTLSPAARAYVAVTLSAARNPEPLPVVSGLGSLLPYVLLFGLVVHVAGRALMVKFAPALVISSLVGTAAGLSLAEMWYGPPRTLSPAARVCVA